MSEESQSSSKYRLDKILGEGGSGTVYLGFDEHNQKVVIKKFKNSVLDIRSQGWKREMETLKQINHPKIPKYLDYYETVEEKRRLPHLVMEYIEGDNLEDVIKKHQKRFTFQESVDLLKDILLLLAYIHSFQPPLIHRDIKPSNLLVQKDGSLALIDFGIAVDDIHKTVGRTLGVGTLGYQAPEQVSGDPTTKSDLYSVGVIAVELFTRISPKELLTHRGVLDWQRKCLELPIAWQRWLDRMLMAEPTGRFESAEEALKNMPEVNVVEEQERIKKEINRAAVHVPEVEVSNNFMKALKARSQKHRADEIAEEEERRLEEEKKREEERQRQIEKERAEVEAQRRKMEKERQEKERRDAIATYKENLETEVAASWDALVQVIARDELPVEEGMAVFVEQFAAKMSFEYNGEILQTSVVELELAKTYPKVETDIVSQYAKKIQRRVKERFESTDDFRQSKEKIAEWESKISTWEDGISQKKEERANLAFWESWLGKTKPIEEAIAKYEGEKQKLQKQIQKIQAQQHKALEQQIQVYMFDWVIMPGEKKVSYSKGDFYVMTTQVTQKFWKGITGQNPSNFEGEDLPVESVSWFDCVIFANILSEKLGLEKVYEIPKELTLGSSQDKDLAKKVKVNTSANGYRLPLEAEWEYAARGGEDYKYAGSNDLNEVGWYDGNSGSKTHGVGQKKSNGYGLYDMSGNVDEWIFDLYSNDSSYRVNRGGSWSYDAFYCGVSYRLGYNPSSRLYVNGVRFFRSVPQDS